MKNHKEKNKSFVSSKVKKAVIAAAGYGTRFLPATKNQPKEMLPIIDKPIIHYLVEEAVNSGITDIILVTRAGLHIMEDFFDSSYEIEQALEKSGKTDLLKMVQDIPKMANFAYVRQTKHLPYGNGSPLLAASSLIDDDEAVVYMFGDDLTISNKPVIKQLIETYEKYDAAAVIATQEVPEEDVVKYGVMDYEENSDIPYKIRGVVEKPSIENAPSRNAQFGRFILSPHVVKELTDTPTGKGGELWLADALDRTVKKGLTVIAMPIEGEWLTTGDPLNYLKATVKYALEREDLSADFRTFIKETIA